MTQQLARELVVGLLFGACVFTVCMIIGSLVLSRDLREPESPADQ
jgi:Ca2+/Na+ antiporter